LPEVKNPLEAAWNPLLRRKELAHKVNPGVGGDLPSKNPNEKTGNSRMKFQKSIGTNKQAQHGHALTFFGRGPERTTTEKDGSKQNSHGVQKKQMGLWR